MKKLILSVSLVILLLLPLARAEVIINTNDWREAIVGIIYSYYIGENPKLVTSLGEMRLLLFTLNKTNPHVVLESNKNSVVKNALQSLTVSGFENVEEIRYDSYTDLQLSLYEEIRNNITGFVVARDGFGMDAIPVVPYALLNKYWLLFYNKDTEAEIIKLINNEKKPVIFYGMFERRPWKKLNNISYEIIDNRNYKDNIIEVFERYLRENYPKWTIIMSPAYIEEETLTKLKPILLTILDPLEVVNLMLNNNLTIAEVIGPENVDYASQIRELSGKKIGVVVKTGRTFTGIEEVRGIVFPIKALNVPEPKPNLSVEKVVYNQKENRLVILFNNTGNVGVHFYISGISLNIGGQLTYPQFSPTLHFVDAGKYLPLPIIYNGSVPESIELLVLYGFEKPIVRQVIPNIYNVSVQNLKDYSEIVLTSAYYEKDSEQLSFDVKNIGNETVYVIIEVLNFNYFGDNITLSSGSPEEIEPGETKKLSVDIYLDEEDIQNNKMVNILMLYGPREDMLLNAKEESAEIKIVVSPITALVVLARENYLVIATVMAIIIILLLVLLLKGKKKKKKR